MKLLFEFFPIILFFAAYKIKGIFYATAIAIIASILQIIYSYMRTRKAQTMMWVNLFVILAFGGATLVLHSELFIKWKPTMLYWIFAIIIASAQVIFKKNIIQNLLQQQICVPDAVWHKLNISWAIFFTVLGATNLFVAYRFPTDIWVNFKLFGIMGFMFIFVVIQSIFLAPHMKKDEEAEHS